MQNDDVVKTQLENGVRIISEKIPGGYDQFPLDMGRGGWFTS